MKLLTLKEDLVKKSGVYLIECNSHKYVGSSISLYERYKQHALALRKGKHYNNFLQRVYDKYPNDISFKLIEICDNYIEREAYYIDYYNCDVNVERNPVTQAKSIETRKKLSMANTNKRLGAENHASVKVYQYTLEGIYVNEYDTIRKAALAINGNESSIGDAAKGDTKSAGGYQWRKEKLDKIPGITKPQRNPRTVKDLIIIDQGVEIKVKSIKEAAVYLNANEGTVRKALTHGFKCKGQVIKLEL
jgi:hypothetical protein